MGGGKSKQHSRLSPAQQKVQDALGDVYDSFFGGNFRDEIRGGFSDLISGSPGDLTALTEGAFSDFREFAIPTINAQASGLSATQSTRRVGEIARSARGVTSDLARIRAQYLDSARNRQMNTLVGLLGSAGNFANANTQDTSISESPLGPILGLVGTIAGAFIGGPAGAAAGGAIGGAVGGGGAGGGK